MWTKVKQEWNNCFQLWWWWYSSLPPYINFFIHFYLILIFAPKDYFIKDNEERTTLSLWIQKWLVLVLEMKSTGVENLLLFTASLALSFSYLRNSTVLYWVFLASSSFLCILLSLSRSLKVLDHYIIHWTFSLESSCSVVCSGMQCVCVCLCLAC